MRESRFGPHETEQLVEALTTLPSGSIVRLAPGRFALTKTLSIANGVTIVGERGQTVLAGNGEVTLVMVGTKGERITLQGLTFDGGEGLWGGAITCGVAATLSIEDCRFVNNSAREDGGAIFLRRAQESRIVRCSFEGNRARRAGGALDVGNGSDVLVDRCVFSNNEAKVGGGVYLNSTAALELRSCTFVNNRATVSPGGAALFVTGAVSSGPSAYVSSSIFAGPDAIAGDPAMKLDVFVAHSILPPGLFEQRGFKSVKPNTLEEAKLVELGPGAWGLAPGAPGTGTADASRIEADARDAFGRPLVCNGVADPGAFAARRPHETGTPN